MGEHGGPGPSLFDSQCTRQLSASPPPFAYSPYHPSLTAYGQPAYGSSSSSSLYPSSASFSAAAAAATTPTPSSFSDIPPFSTADYGTTPIKRYTDDGILNPFNMSYASMAGIDLGPEYHHHAHHSHHNHHPHSHQPPLLSHLPVSQP